MDDSPVKGLTLSSPFGENNENDESGSPKLENSKKIVRKHYMSPTISAATKAAALVPRKKILADRNEGFTFCMSPKSLVGSACSVRFSSCPDTDCDDKQNRFDGDSSLREKPYDPLTNYLSPRPKFLRYNPNKKRRIFLCEENEIGEIKDGLDFVSTRSSFESGEVVEERIFEEVCVKKEDVELVKTDDECDDYEDEDVEDLEGSEEFEGNKCWGLLRILKFLLVLGSLILSTSFIYSMNSPDPSLIQEVVWEFRGEFVNQSTVHEESAIRKEYSNSGFEVKYGKAEESHISWLDLVTQQDIIDNEFAEIGIFVGHGTGNGLWDSTVGLPGVSTEKSEDAYNDWLMSKAEASATLQWEDPRKSEANTDDKVVDSEADQEMRSTEEAFNQVQGAETVEIFEYFREDLLPKIEPSTDVNGYGNGVVDSAVGLPEATIEKSEDVYSVESIRKVEAEPIISGANTDIAVVDSKAETLDSSATECKRVQEMESTEEAFDQMQGAEILEVFESFQEDLLPIIEPSTDMNAENVMMESKDIILQFKVLVLAVSLSIIAALGFLYRARKRKTGSKYSCPTRNNSGKEDYLPLDTHHQNAETAKAANRIQNSNAICGTKEEKMKRIESAVSPSTAPFSPMKVEAEEFSRRSQAPTVELLGELVIGGEANRSFRSIKRRRVLDSGVKNGNNHLYTQISLSKDPIVENQSYSPQPGLSNAASTSSQKKKSFSKKEQTEGGKVSSTSSPTPVRRSSRIRSKAVSPC
ncbi:hypothetical protein DCAR_0518528 [Daucus carota subsp. sativus]|uniref:Uncharacterized protein n=1 Tax=Daucus carota subsp. sativus TaxID=79200 RepID=A0AAF1B0G9_DAUCS|nr:PREDICTED: uncharacterized protein LOC108220969 [Daucus carota subsp. sativus]WOG99180.1 hypothetical protein DCAR_0518528 [Daucus carota subsp. sativus]